jgi:hypothetical protein
MQKELQNLKDYLGVQLPHLPLPLGEEELPPHYVDPFTRNWDNHKYPDFIFTFWPFTEELYHPLNPVFLHELDGLGQTHDWGAFLSRDGLIPLLWWLENNPLPQTEAQLFVHKRFQNLLPKSWWENIGTYRVASAEEEKNLVPRNRVCLSSIITQNFISTEFVEKRLDEIFEQLEKIKCDPLSFDCYFVFRDDPYHWVETDKLVNEFNSLVGQRLGKKARFFEEKEIVGKSSFLDCYYADFNMQYFLSDDYIQYLALSRGARLLLQPEIEEGESYSPVSPFHGLLINKSPQVKEWPSEIQEHLNKVHGISLIDEKGERTAHWPKDFWLYAKKLLELDPQC